MVYRNGIAHFEAECLLHQLRSHKLPDRLQPLYCRSESSERVASKPHALLQYGEAFPFHFTLNFSPDFRL